MIVRGRWLLAICGLLAALTTPVAVAAEPVVQSVEEHRDDRGEIDRRGRDFVHRPTGYVFSGILGALPARKTITFGPSDAQLYYTLDGGAQGDPWISLYVYPATLPLDEEQAGVEQVVVTNYGATKMTRPAQIAAVRAGALEAWYRAKIEGVEVLTGVRVAQVDGWNIKVRVSIPVSGGDVALQRAAAALAAIPMAPTGLRRPTPQSPPQAATAAVR